MKTDESLMRCIDHFHFLKSFLSSDKMTRPVGMRRLALDGVAADGWMVMRSTQLDSMFRRQIAYDWMDDQYLLAQDFYLISESRFNTQDPFCVGFVCFTKESNTFQSKYQWHSFALGYAAKQIDSQLSHAQRSHVQINHICMHNFMQFGHSTYIHVLVQD